MGTWPRALSYLSEPVKPQETADYFTVLDPAELALHPVDTPQGLP